MSLSSLLLMQIGAEGPACILVKSRQPCQARQQKEHAQPLKEVSRDRRKKRCFRTSPPHSVSQANCPCVLNSQFGRRRLADTVREEEGLPTSIAPFPSDRDAMA